MSLRGVTHNRPRIFSVTPVLVIVLVLSVPVFGVQPNETSVSSGGVWHIQQLALSGDWHHGWILFRRHSPLDRGLRLRHGHHSIYTAYVIPGVEYAIGLRYRDNGNNKLYVMVFDRWPFDERAKRYDLPMGPVVRVNKDVIEYRWRIGISPRSAGNQIFIVVEAEAPVGREAVPLRHSIFLIDTPRRPMDRFGEGITYLSGPADLKLAASPADRQMVFVERPSTGALGTVVWQPDRNLIRNGDFHLGLDGWELISEQGPDQARRHMAVGDEGLRVWGGVEPLLSVAKQRIQRHVANAASLLLSITVMIEEGGKSTDTVAPLAVSVCYVDIRDIEHCGTSAYRTGFTTGIPSRGNSAIVQVVQGEWNEFEEDLSKLTPPPLVVTSIAIEGGGVKGAVAWVRDVSLSVTKGDSG